jgi:hypothetical protein
MIFEWVLGKFFVAVDILRRRIPRSDNSLPDNSKNFAGTKLKEFLDNYMQMSSSYWNKNRWDFVFANSTVVVHPLDGEVYAQIINLSTSYDVYFHGAREIPEISKQMYTFPETDYATVELLALEIFTSPDAKELSILG